MGFFNIRKLNVYFLYIFSVQCYIGHIRDLCAVRLQSQTINEVYHYHHHYYYYSSPYFPNVCAYLLSWK